LASLKITTTLSTTTDNIVPYLPIEATSPLVNAGIGTYNAGGSVEFVPANDARGTLRNQPDKGAYEYEDVQTGLNPTGIDDGKFRITSTKNGINIEANVDGKLSVYTLLGALYAERFISKGEIESLVLPAGLYVVQLSGKSKKVIVK
ncbi:MAG: T9SS type A sorting domain-containing protein, partial [Prevotellaceae bacterium]|nr:T9SS type A sorting domain-containing protein [Prevotellaceae bacterium]